MVSRIRSFLAVVVVSQALCCYDSRSTLINGFPMSTSMGRTVMLPWTQQMSSYLDAPVPIRRIFTLPLAEKTTTTTSVFMSTVQYYPPNHTSSSIRRSSIQNDTDVLWSYVFNIQRSRRVDEEESSLLNHSRTAESIRWRTLKQPVFSLIHFLQESSNGAETAVDSIGEPLERAVVQAIRVASKAGDYRLIRQVVDSAILYAQTVGGGILSPRIIGEAIAELDRTGANLNKIRSTWSLIKNDPWIWSRPISALEVNAMLQVYLRHGKVRAALDLYYDYSMRKEDESRCATDPYSLCLVLQALASSVTNSTAANTSNTSHCDNAVPLHNAELVPLVSQRYLGFWQWHEGIRMLDHALMNEQSTMEATTDRSIWHNNPMWTALLQLNDRCTQSALLMKPGSIAHNGPVITKVILHILKQHSILPDVITSTLLLSSLSANDWELAATMLRNSVDYHSNHIDGNSSTFWRLAAPNEYMYSAVMALCSKSRQNDVALQLLHELETKSNLQPNIYVYNSVLQGLSRGREEPRFSRSRKRNVKKPFRGGAKGRVQTAVRLWQRLGQMSTTVLHMQPDTVTYNTIFSVLVGASPYMQDSDWKDVYSLLEGNVSNADSSFLEQTVHFLLNKMVEQNLFREEMTYKRGIQALMGCCDDLDSASAILRLLNRAMMDQRPYQISLLDLCNESLLCFGSTGNIVGMLRVLSLMVENSLDVNSDYFLHVVNAVGNGKRTWLLPDILSGKIERNTELYELGRNLGLDWHQIEFPSFNSLHFSAAISCCLRESDFSNAKQILSQMREFGFLPTQEALHDISRAYAVLTLEHVRNKSNQAALESAKALHLRARSSFSILSSIEDPPSSLISIVARACAKAGLFPEAQSLLRMLHKRVLQSRWEEMDDNIPAGAAALIDNRQVNHKEMQLPHLHRELLRSCARQGNVTNALSLCEDIQYISKQLMTATIHHKDSGASLYNAATQIGMTATGWKSLLIAACRSGHWKVCLSTLQFLRPYLEATNPSESQNKEERRLKAKAYAELESSMNTAVRCLAVRSQYGWIVRAIDDWIEWSGRRPPLDAVLAGVRVLASRGRGEEVNNLLTKCANIPSSGTKCDDTMYNAMMFAGAITALYHEGLYDEADDAFVVAISQQALPFNLQKESLGTETSCVLDLHGMNLAVAHSAVRIALQQLAISNSNWDGSDRFDYSMVIITGRGLNSALRMRPVLRPNVQRLLVEEFYPPLSSVSVPGNLGAIRIPSSDITQWLDHQRQQKGARLLLVAAMLRNIVAPGGRLSAVLSQLGGPSEQ
jgi:pentatricopeptide repeat protein